MGEGPRYAFHPLERRGVLLGLDVGQLVTMAAGAIVAMAAHAALGGAVGVCAGVAVGTGGVLAALWTRNGAPLAARVVTGSAWLLRRPARPVLDDAPTAGRRMSPEGSALVPQPRPRADPGIRSRTCPPGIELVQDEGLPGEGPLGVVRDRRGGTWAAVIPVRGCSFSLLDPTEQAYRLEAWRRVLGSLARPGSPVVRLQWVQRSWPGSHQPAEPADGVSPPGRPGLDPSGSYRQVCHSVRQEMVHRHAWLLLATRPAHHQLRARGAPAQAITELRRELRLLAGQLRDAALDPLEPLDPLQLRSLIAGPCASGAPTAAPATATALAMAPTLPTATATATASSPASAPAPAWPLAAQDGWSTYRADQAIHATYWIAEWPRVQVGPDFLTPLLLGAARTAVSVLMAPVPPDRAMREVRSARTADLADAQLRARAGFLQSARRDRESEGATQRETELADGHQEFRFSGYVTVSAEDPEQLAAGCAATEHAAQSARLELRRLYGRQAEAFTWTLPLGRGLR